MNCLYCDTPIAEHEANRCLDAWVAEAVMGLEVEYKLCLPDYEYGGWDLAEDYYIGEEGNWTLEKLKANPDVTSQPCALNEYDFHDVVKEYSTLIANAWEVVEKYKKEGSMDVEVAWNGFQWFAGMTTQQLDGRETAPTAPLAICRAALEAVTNEHQ